MPRNPIVKRKKDLLNKFITPYYTTFTQHKTPARGGGLVKREILYCSVDLKNRKSV